MLMLPIVMWMMLKLSAPSWCFTLWWICAICTAIRFCVELIKLGKELKD